MKPVFCFIDDAQFELDNFRQNAAWAFEKADFVYARSFEQAKAALAGGRPLCFLLDLYGAEAGGSPALPGQDEMQARIPGQTRLDDLYGGLPREPKEAGNLFLRRLHSRVQSWQDIFRHAAECQGQSRAYGLDNLAQARQHYPWAAALAYSRKAFYGDAMEASIAGMDLILQKPQGAGDEAIARATNQAAPNLAHAAHMAVERRLHRLAGGLGLRLALQAETRPLAQAVNEALQGGKGRALQKVIGEAEDHLAPAEQELLMALADWSITINEEL